MSWFMHSGRPSFWRVVALLLVGYVAYLTVPVVFRIGTSPFQRAFAAIALAFFAYVIFRAATYWETLAADMFRKP